MRKPGKVQVKNFNNIVYFVQCTRSEMSIDQKITLRILIIVQVPAPSLQMRENHLNYKMNSKRGGKKTRMDFVGNPARTYERKNKYLKPNP